MRGDTEVRRAIEDVLDGVPALAALSSLDRMDLADRLAAAAEEPLLDKAHREGWNEW
jgi:hypothetical protein